MSELTEITEEELREAIKDAVENIYLTQRALAEKMNLSTTYVNDIILGTTPISDNVARFFGYELIKKYRELPE